MKITQSKYEYFLVFLMIFLLAMENIKVFDLLGAPFKPAHIVFALTLLHIVLIRKFKVTVNRLVLFVFYLALPVLPLYRISNTMEWLKSYVIWVFAVTYLLFGYKYCNRVFQANRRKLIKVAINLIMVTQVLGVIQFALMNFFDIEFLFDPFGSFQFSPSFISEKDGVFRAFSVYHEPSVLGWINSTQLAMLFFTKEEKVISKPYWYFCIVLSALATFASVSATGMFLVLGLIAVYLMLRAKKKRTIVMIMLVLVAFFVIWSYTDLLAPLRRFAYEYDTLNTSGYERFNAPMQYAVKTLQVYPLLGRGIGISGSVDLVGVLDSSNYDTANNSFYQVIMNFGLSSVFLFIPLIGLCYKTIKKNKKYILIAFNLIGVLIATGAYLSLDFLVVLNLSMFLFYSKSGTKKVNKNSQLEARANEDPMGL